MIWKEHLKVAMKKYKNITGEKMPALMNEKSGERIALHIRLLDEEYEKHKSETTSDNISKEAGL